MNKIDTNVLGNPDRQIESTLVNVLKKSYHVAVKNVIPLHLEHNQYVRIDSFCCKYCYLVP